MRKPDHRPEVKAPPRWIFPEPAHWWLDNGLQVLAFHRPGQHIAAVSLVLDNPLSTEPGDIEGVATITQRCLDEGTATHSGPSFAERLEDIGAVLSGSAGYAASDLLLEVPASRLSEALPLLAEAISEPELRASDVRAPPVAAAGGDRPHHGQLLQPRAGRVPAGLHPRPFPRVPAGRRHRCDGRCDHAGGRRGVPRPPLPSRGRDAGHLRRPHQRGVPPGCRSVRRLGGAGNAHACTTRPRCPARRTAG